MFYESKSNRIYVNFRSVLPTYQNNAVTKPQSSLHVKISQAQIDIHVTNVVSSKHMRRVCRHAVTRSADREYADRRAGLTHNLITTRDVNYKVYYQRSVISYSHGKKTWIRRRHFGCTSKRAAPPDSPPH